MKYNIISIDDSRAAYKTEIRKRVWQDEVAIPSVNARELDVNEEAAKRNVPLDGQYLTVGEIGVFLSTFDCWQWAVDNDEELLVFEDDAIPRDNFNQLLGWYRSELPSDYGYLSLWVPKNQYPDYHYDVVYDEHGSPTHVGDHKNGLTSIYNFGAIRLAKVYQGYGNVATLYSPAGAEALIRETRRISLCGPVDCFIHERAHARQLDGYAPKPHWAKAVDYDWAAETTVHNTEYYLEKYT